MTNYELIFILPGTLAEDETKPYADQVTAILKEAGIEKIEMNDLGKNRLAYPMKHIRYGYFFNCRFEADAEVIPSIQAKLRLMSDLLRTLIQKYDPTKQVEAAISHASAPVHGGHKMRQEKKQQRGADLTLPEMEQAPVAKKPAAKAAEPKEEKKVTLEEIDSKLDKILETDIADV